MSDEWHRRFDEDLNDGTWIDVIGGKKMVKSVKVKGYTAKNVVSKASKKRINVYNVFADEYTGIWGAFNKDDLKSMLEREGIEFYKTEGPLDFEYVRGYLGIDVIKRGELMNTYG